MISTRSLRHARASSLSSQYILSTAKIIPLLHPSHAYRPLSSASSSPAAFPDSKTTIQTTQRIQDLAPHAANPPHTTRPAPLLLPSRSSSPSTLSHLFATGKAYLRFYKTGLKNIYLNQKLARALRNGDPLPEIPSLNPDPLHELYEPSAPPIIPVPSRAAHQLEARARHDLHKLPVFGLILAVCGEFTPFVVLLLPRAVPYTCRIPRQVEKLRRRAEERRAASFSHLRNIVSAAEGGKEKGPDGTVAAVHVAKSLGLVSGLWDKVGFVPASMARARAERRVEFLAVDDGLLVGSGGVDALEGDEVFLACEERGVDVRGKEEADLRGVLGRWLERSGGVEVEMGERKSRVWWLLMRRPEEW